MPKYEMVNGKFGISEIKQGGVYRICNLQRKYGTKYHLHFISGRKVIYLKKSYHIHLTIQINLHPNQKLSKKILQLMNHNLLYSPTCHHHFRGGFPKRPLFPHIGILCLTLLQPTHQIHAQVLQRLLLTKNALVL